MTYYSAEQCLPELVTQGWLSKYYRSWNISKSTSQYYLNCSLGHGTIEKEKGEPGTERPASYSTLEASITSRILTTTGILANGSLAPTYFSPYCMQISISQSLPIHVNTCRGLNYTSIGSVHYFQGAGLASSWQQMPPESWSFVEIAPNSSFKVPEHSTDSKRISHECRDWELSIILAKYWTPIRQIRPYDAATVLVPYIPASRTRLDLDLICMQVISRWQRSKSGRETRGWKCKNHDRPHFRFIMLGSGLQIDISTWKTSLAVRTMAPSIFSTLN